MKKFIFTLSIVSASLIASASEINMKKKTDYNGGDAKGSICSIRLIESLGSTMKVEVDPNSFTTKFQGPSRAFVISRKDANSFVGKGSAQQYISPVNTVKHADETLVLNLNGDGTPHSFVLTSKSLGATLTCDGLLDAPY